MNTIQENWWVITLCDTNHASGTFLADLLVFISEKVDISDVIIGNVEGKGVFQIASDRRYVQYTISTLLPIIRKVQQFYWCDIFCYASETNQCCIDFWDMNYPDIIMDTSVSLRVVDYNDVEIFTSSEKLYQDVILAYYVSGIFYGKLSSYTFLE